MYMSDSKQGGFTLMELLVAMLVFSLLTGFAYRSVSELSSVSRSLSEEETQFRSLQQAMSMIERDLRQSSNVKAPSTNAVNAPPPDPDAPSLLLSLDVESVAGKKSIEYLFGKGIFYRNVLVGSGSSGDAQDALRLIDGLDNASVNLLASSSGIADGLELTLQHSALGPIERLIQLPVGNLQNLSGLNTLD